MHILIAEDDKDACEMYRILLKSCGHKVKITDNGQECLKIYRESLSRVSSDDESGRFDVVILDYLLPGLDGLKLAEMILKSRPGQRIIIASAYANTISTDKVDDLQGFIEIVAKPFEPRGFIEMVENLPPSSSSAATADAQKMTNLVTLMDINSKFISEEGVLKGLENLSKVFGPKMMSFVTMEFHSRGLITTVGAGNRHSGEKLLSVIGSVFGASNKEFCVRFFLDFFD